MATPLQKMGAYALMNPDREWQTNMIESLTKRRNKIITYLGTLDLHAENVWAVCISG